MNLNIYHIYPDLLNLYGDRGNIVCLKHRLEKRGIDVKIHEVRLGEKFNADDADIALIGGGQNFEFNMLLDDIKGDKEKAIKYAIENDVTFLAVCGGYQLLGNYLKNKDGSQVDFIGAVDFYSVDTDKRMTGNYAFKTESGIEIVGFENHAGKTYLGENTKPLGTVIKGFGNNGEDGTEGVIYKNTFCTYSHGPVLPKNPQFADLLIIKALTRKYGEVELKSLIDGFENKAHDFVMNSYIN